MTFLRTNALALVALFVALGGTSYAAAQIGSAQIKDGAVKGRNADIDPWIIGVGIGYRFSL